MRRPEPGRVFPISSARQPLGRKATGRAAILIPLLLCGAPLSASAAITAPSSASSTAAVSPAELRAAMEAAAELGQAGDCVGALARLDPLLPRLDRGKDRHIVQRLRLACLGPAGRVDELAEVQRELAVAMPRDGLVRSFGILLAADKGQFTQAAEQLATLAEDDPASLALVAGRSWRGIAQKLSEQSQFELRGRVNIALARADWQPRDEPDMRDLLAKGAIEALLIRGEAHEAAGLLPRVAMPELLYAMATERLYEPLWPQIEARLGPRTGKAVDRFAAARLEDFARTPDDPHAVREAIRAFILLGRHADAAEIAARVPIRDGMGEDDVASVRYHAQALAALGRRGEAIERLRGFAGIDLARNPEAASGRIGLAEMLDEDGQAEQAFTIARETLARGGEMLSPWGKAWLKRTEACALGTLGRAVEARAAGDAIKAAASENQPAAIEALLCLKRDAEAEAIAVKALASHEGASALADQFQPDDAIWAPAQSRLRALWTPFLARPEVKAAFERRARILPRPLWPAGEQRPIPRRPSANSGPVA